MDEMGTAKWDKGSITEVDYLVCGEYGKIRCVELFRWMSRESWKNPCPRG